MKLNSSLLCATLLLSTSFASADDWPCTVTLCLLNPQGPTAVAACVAPINRLWSELAHGHGFPTCTGAGDSIPAIQYSTAEDCPPQYIMHRDDDAGTPYCGFMGSIMVMQNNEPYYRIWWNPSGSSVTENLSTDAPVTASSQQFMADYNAWVLAQQAQAQAAANSN